MTVLFDRTVQAVGWKGGTFPTGEFPWPTAPTITGLSARSFWAQSLNGQAIDISLGFSDSAGNRTSPVWVNQHTAGVLQGVTIPSPQLITPSTYVLLTTRAPTANGATLARFTVSDQATTPPPTVPACQYGTQPQSGVQPAVVITSSLLDAILALVDLPALAVALVAQVGTSLNIQQLCASQPPPMPELSADLFANSPQDLYQALRAVAWPYFCQCVPGSPNPINFPLPTFTPPSGWPTAPTFSCDPAQLCSTLERIEQLLNVVNGTVAADYNLTTLIQRHRVPFAVIPSTFHTGLTGTGSLAVQGLIGVQYQVDALPDGVRVTPGAPPYIRDLGWIGLELAAGGSSEHRVTRQQELWLPPTAELANTLAWSLTPGTSITVRELLAEP